MKGKKMENRLTLKITPVFNLFVEKVYCPRDREVIKDTIENCLIHLRPLELSVESDEFHNMSLGNYDYEDFLRWYLNYITNNRRKFDDCMLFTKYISDILQINNLNRKYITFAVTEV